MEKCKVFRKKVFGIFKQASVSVLKIFKYKKLGRKVSFSKKKLFFEVEGT